MQAQKVAINETSTILSYKGKILLVSQDNHFQGIDKNVWSLIPDKKIKAMQFKDCELVSIAPDLLNLRLTDKHVNKMIRQEGMRLEFYRYEELKKLILTENTRAVLSNFQKEILEILK